MITTIVLLVIMAITFARMSVNLYLRRKAISAPKKYDVNYTRQKELEIWGYYWTPLPEGEKPKELSSVSEASNIVPVMVPASQNCSVCERSLISYGRDTCQRCTLALLQKRKAEREKQAYQPRYKRIEYQGQTWGAPMATEVPTNAHAEIMETYKHGDPFGTWMVFKWTDEKTGKQMVLRSMARPVDGRAPRIGSEIVKR